MEVLLLADSPQDPRFMKLKAYAVSEGENLNGTVWTREVMRRDAASFIGTPVNFRTLPDGSADGHTTQVVGTIVGAAYRDDPTGDGRARIEIEGNLYKHYYPDLLAHAKTLFEQGRMGVSMEYLMTEMAFTDTGGFAPKAGWFSGLGMVGHPADTGSRILALASTKEKSLDERNQQLLSEENKNFVTQLVASVVAAIAPIFAGRKDEVQEDKGADTPSVQTPDNRAADAVQTQLVAERDEARTQVAAKVAEIQAAQLKIAELEAAKAEGDEAKAKLAAIDAGQARVKELSAESLLKAEGLDEILEAAEKLAQMGEDAYAAYKAGLKSAGVATAAFNNHEAGNSAPDPLAKVYAQSDEAVERFAKRNNLSK